jgi:hypothetical protein
MNPKIKKSFFEISLILTFLSFNSYHAGAAVWEDSESWSVQYEQKFALWMQSSAVREGMFNDPHSPYYGVSTDCADTAYALRAVFAFENKLPFAITNPSGSRGDVSKTLNNKSNKFDYAGPENKRLVAMITEIGDSVGTENLTRYDTYPVAIKSITPGSIFTYKMAARFGKFIRHTYNIKDINPVGTFDVVYSTQANHASHGDLLRRRDREFENLPNDPWGFRKFRWPDQLGKDLSVIAPELGASNEQYELAQRMDTRTFFKYVGSVLATTTESSGERLSRVFKAVCQESQARVGYVNEALAYLQTSGNACMDYEHFDAYSTPARDLALKEMYEKFQQAYTEAKNLAGVDPQIYAFADYIFRGRGSVQADLLAACPINYRSGMTIDMATFWSRMSKDRLSSHPNDIVEVRWGEKTSPLTKCKRWY